MRRTKPKPDLCEICVQRKALDLHNLSGKYIREEYDWKWICRKCHMELDGRLKKLHERAKLSRKHNEANRARDTKGRYVKKQ